MGQLGNQHKSSKLRKFKSFIKSIKSKVNRPKRDTVGNQESKRMPCYLPTLTRSPYQTTFPYPHPYSYAYSTSSNIQYTIGPYAVSQPSPYPLRQHIPGTWSQGGSQGGSQGFTESEYEEMTSDFCTLPRKKMKYRMKQRVFEKSLNAILLEAKKEIIEESSGDEKDSTYVQETNDNIYEELNLSRSFVEQIYEEII